MHIFLVNDDGITAKGIRALCEAALERGHRVSMCAPKTQQSAASQRITLADPIYVKPCPTHRDDVTAYAITGSPTDCVRIGLFQLIQDPIDIVISGVNDGYNAGMAVHYSGTVGAATEGALLRHPSMAVSIHHKATEPMLRNVARLAIRTAEYYVHVPTPPVTVLNINAPLTEPENLLEPVLVPLSTAAYMDRYERMETPRMGACYWLNSGERTEEPADNTDLAMLAKGHITYTFLGNPCDHGAQFNTFMADLGRTL